MWGLSPQESNRLLLLFIGCSIFFAVAFWILALIYERARKAAQARDESYQASIQTLSEQLVQTRQELDETTLTLQTSRREKAELETELEAIKQQCARLRGDLDEQAQQVQQDSQAKSFQQIQTLLTQHPTVRRMAETKPDLPARNVVALFTSLDNLVKLWGYQSIGSPWEKVSYDPQLHQADAGDVGPGETVYVRFIGYRHGKSGQIVVPAKVSRTLPPGIAPATVGENLASGGLSS